MLSFYKNKEWCNGMKKTKKIQQWGKPTPKKTRYHFGVFFFTKGT